MNLYKVTTCKFNGEREPQGTVHRLPSYDYAEHVCVIDNDVNLADDIMTLERFTILETKNGRILPTKPIMADISYGIKIEKIRLNELPLNESLKLKWYYMRYSVLMACLARYQFPDPRLKIGHQKVKKDRK